MEQSSPSLRLLLAFVTAGLASLFLFWMLHLVTGGGGHGSKKLEAMPAIDFVRLKKDSEIETRQRQKPKPPPPPKEPPPPPKLKVASDTPPQENPLPFNIPNLGLSASVGGGPFVGEMGSGSGAGTGGMGLFDGDIIPLARIAPQYPRAAQIDGIEGTVKLEVIVNSDGSVRSAKVLQAKPRGVFEAVAVTAMLKWKFKPRVVDGKPVEQRGVQELNFTLSGE